MKKCLIEEWILLFVLIIQVVLVCMGFLSRYIFEWSFSFTEEISRYLLIWLACLGFSACQGRGEMIGFVYPKLDDKYVGRIVKNISYIFLLVFSILLIYSSCKMILLQWEMGNKTAVMGWPIYWVSLALPIGMVLLVIRLIWKK